MVNTSHVVWTTPVSIDHHCYVIANDAPTEIKNWAAIEQAAGHDVWVCDGTADDVEINAALTSLPNFSGDINNTKTGSVLLIGHNFVLSNRIDFPPVHDFYFYAPSSSFAGAGIRIDSAMDAKFYFALIGGATGNVSLEINPRTAGPDSLTTFIDNYLEWSSIALNIQGTSGSIGLKLDPSSGVIQFNQFVGRDIHGYETLISVSAPGGGQWFQGNQFYPGRIFTGTTGITMPNNNCSDNIWTIPLLDASLTTGLTTGGRQDIFIVSAFDSALTWGSGSVRNMVIMGGGGNITVTDNSTGNTNKIIGATRLAYGSGTILNGTTSAVITHGRGFTPVAPDINITWSENPTNDPGNWWVSGLSSAQFTVNVRNDPGSSNLDFSWGIRQI